MKKFKTVGEYFKLLPVKSKERLEMIRRIVKKEAPEAEEIFSYQMPAFKLNKRILIYYSAWREHIGLYPPPPKSLARETAKYKGPGGNLKFPFAEPLPVGLIRKVIKEKVKENVKRYSKILHNLI